MFIVRKLSDLNATTHGIFGYLHVCGGLLRVSLSLCIAFVSLLIVLGVAMILIPFVSCWGG